MRVNSPYDSSYLKMVSAFVDMEDAVPYFSSSAASQKAKFSPKGTHADIHVNVSSTLLLSL